MPVRSRFFDSVSGDRVYGSDAFRQIFAAMARNDGVLFGWQQSMSVVQSTPAAMSITVSLGAGFVQGGFIEIYTTAEVLTIAAAHATNPRIDTIVMRLDLNNRTMSLAVVQGTPATSPVAPTLTRTGTIWEEPLADVRVNAAATSIVTSNITDRRARALFIPDLSTGIPNDVSNTGTGSSGTGLAASRSDHVHGLPDASALIDYLETADGSGSGLDADTLDGFQPSMGAGINSIAQRNASGDLTARQLISTVATGTAPLDVTSSTVVAGLNADLVDGSHASAFATSGHDHTNQLVKGWARVAADGTLSTNNNAASVTKNGTGDYSVTFTGITVTSAIAIVRSTASVGTGYIARIYTTSSTTVRVLTGSSSAALDLPFDVWVI